MFQKDSALAPWHRRRTEGPSGALKTTMIVTLARKLLIALWRLVTTGEVPDGVAATAGEKTQERETTNRVRHPDCA